MGWIRRLRATLFESGRADEIEEELRFHLDQRTEDYVERGVDVDDARRRARRRFGSLAAARDEVRDADEVRWLADLIGDLRYAVRILKKAPTFSATAILALALATGVNVAIFSVVYGVLFKGLLYPESDQLLQLSENHAGAVSPLNDAVLSDLTFDAWRQGTQTLSGMGVYADRAYSIAGIGDAERVRAVAVSPEVFDVLRAVPAMGRFFLPEEVSGSGAGVVVLSHAFWQRRFGGRRDVVGTTVSLDGRAHTVIGVTSEGFSFPDSDRQLYTPFVARRVNGVGTERQVNVFSVIARLAPGATPDQASAEGTAIARALGPRPIAADILFGKGGAVIVSARPLVAGLTEEVRPVLLLLAASVTLLLLLGCANVAGLYLSRGLAREREFAVRATLGAGHGRLARQLGVESLALAFGAAVLGVVLAWALIQAWPVVAPRSFPRTAEVTLTWGSLAYAFALSLGTGLLVGMAPILHAIRVRPVPTVQRNVSIARSSGRVRHSLLILQSSVAVVLVVGAISLTRSLERYVSQDTGYDAEGVITARVSLDPGRDTASRWPRLAADLVERTSRLPFVDAVGAGSMAPLGSSTLLVGFRVAGDRSEPQIAQALGYIVTPGYADVLKLRVRQGRFLNESDASAPVQSMVVNEEFVRRYLGDGKPAVGRRYENVLKRDATTEIVGVAGNVLRAGYGDEPQAEFYVPLGNQGLVTAGREIYLVVRAGVDAATVASALRPITREIDANAPLHSVRALSDEVASTAGGPRFAVLTLVVFASLALGLAVLGLHGALTYALSQRTRELGIRNALGATRGNLMALVLRDAAVVTVSGLALGISAAAAGLRVVQTQVFGLDPSGTGSFLAAPVLVVCATLIPCALASWRVARLDPSEVLRQE